MIRHNLETGLIEHIDDPKCQAMMGCGYQGYHDCMLKAGHEGPHQSKGTEWGLSKEHIDVKYEYTITFDEDAVTKSLRKATNTP